MGLLKKLKKISNNAAIATVEERSRHASVASTSSTTNAVHVVINISWEIIVDNMGDIGDIQTSSSDRSSDQDRAAPVTEHFESTLALTLRTVTMNRCRGERLINEKV